MNAAPPFRRADLDQLLADHQEAIRLLNELEFELYRLGEAQSEERITGCQQAGGALIGLLRTLLFRHDQQVFPVLESMVRRENE